MSKTAPAVFLSFLFLFVSLGVGSAHAGEDVSNSLLHNDAGYIEFALYRTGPIIPYKEISKFISSNTAKLVLSDKFESSTDQMVIDFKTITNVHEEYAPPSGNFLRYFGRGLSSDQAEELGKSSHVIVFYVASSNKYVLEANKEATLLLHSMADKFGGFIWDEDTREIFTKEAWRDKRLSMWTDQWPNVANHITIHVYQPNDLYARAITLGMAKFGLPDIAINNFAWSVNRGMGNLINLLAQQMVEGYSISRKGLLADISSFKNEEAKRFMEGQLFENAQKDVVIKVLPSKPEEGDPNNSIIELAFDHYPGKSLQEKQERFLGAMFGWQETMSMVEHNNQILAASNRARSKLPQLKSDFNKGLEPGGHINVKAPFETLDGGNEYMWVDVIEWKSDQITGLLKNEPYNIPSLRGGQSVTVTEDIVFDYIRYFGDGSSEGNETGELIMKYQSQTRSYNQYQN
ncbi:hypothetical protein OLMES_0012 [Oleiphilus messinensis]|uniref:DUF2314 domain-containing protein n=1 Tax=Oleiphilus messinensis TaxID=141451 RepID=A0A1Y0I147_9GAMM|nr:DUF2314 domain-containing protein [Oleiphilus messinensis]ARU54121.1 hypothetical protein OLMES_0012 [Oleiphilus messinensis]